MVDLRRKLLLQWINQQLGSSLPELSLISGDASFRRYFRFNYDNTSYIAVDSPPQHENNHAFFNVANMLADNGSIVPSIEKIDFNQGFMMLSDLGDELYLSYLTPQNVDELYLKAIDSIIGMQAISPTKLQELPLFDSNELNQEMSWFSEWLVGRHLNLELTLIEKNIINEAFVLLTENALNQPQVFVHRDYHSRNLMISSQGTPAIIDFQDAVIGPISYDLVSLIKDSYIQWSEQEIYGWCRYFYQQLSAAGTVEQSFDEFFKSFELMGIQRNLKILGIFCRLQHRDSKSGYLKDLPLTFNYLINATAKYPELNAFYEFLKLRIQPAMGLPSGLPPNNIELT